MKWFVVIWMILAGIGMSYSIVSERQKKVQLWKEMEQSLKKLAYYMGQWRMPVREAIMQVAREERGVLHAFYINLGKILEKQQEEDFGKLWQEQSSGLWKGQIHLQLGGEVECACRNMRTLWTDAFVKIPIEPEALNHSLLLRAEEIEAHRREIEGKYKGERKLVFTMGFFVSAFFCLIFL